MSPVCWICLDLLPDSGKYHSACLDMLWGVSTVPAIAFDLLAVNGWADEHGGRLSISGFQPKAPAALSKDRSALVLVESNSTHIVKTPQSHMLHLPQNEHLTMRLARMVGLSVAEHGLIELSDGTIAYVTRRFDRPAQGMARVHMLDFCQLSDRAPEQKDQASAEECAKLVRDYGSPQAARELFRLFLFSYWVRNGDLHLKNMAMLWRPALPYELAPAYDLLCTEPYHASGMTLPVLGERKNIGRPLWVRLGVEFGLLKAEAEEMIEQLAGRLEEAEALVERSLLPNAEWKRRYVHFLEKRSRQLLDKGGRL